jgi:F-type H+-transporting ATPase subunit delta
MDTVAGVLSKKMGTSVTLSNEIDERIIGGMIVKINDLLIDLSVRSKLAHLQQQIYG